MPSPNRIPMGLHVPEADAAQIEELIEQLVHASRHAVLLACLRRGVEAFRAEPQAVLRYLPEGRGKARVRVRAGPRES